MSKLWQEKNDAEIKNDIETMAKDMKVTPWNIMDYIHTKNDLLNLVWAGIEGMGDPMTEKDFEYLLFLCQDVLDIAKKKGWK